MKGLFIPEITAEMFRNVCLESIEQLMEEGEIYDIEYDPKRKKGHWIEQDDGWGGIYYECSECREAFTLIDGTPQDNLYNFCPNCGTQMIREGEEKQSEKDLVSRKEATRHLKKRLMETALNNVGIKENADYVYSEMAENRIDIWMDELQAVQPEIIRCGGCRWFGKIDDRFYRKNTCTNPRVGMKVGENDFCSYAEAGEAGE